MEQKVNNQGPRAGQRRKEPRFEFIPSIMVGINVRAVLPKVWPQICKMVHASYGGKCCECLNDLPVLDCHEVWKYDWVLPLGQSKKIGTMRLTGLLSLCRLCHGGKHINFERYKALQQVTAHLMKLYGLSESHLDRIVREAVDKVEIFSFYEYLDLTYLNDERFDRFREQIGHHYSDRKALSVLTDEQLLRRFGPLLRPGSRIRSRLMDARGQFTA